MRDRDISPPECFGGLEILLHGQQGERHSRCGSPTVPPETFNQVCGTDAPMATATLLLQYRRHSTTWQGECHC